MDRREFLGLGLIAVPALLGLPSVPASRAGAREPWALVTADLEAHVVVVGLDSGRVRARVRTLEGPRSIEAAPGGRAIVAHADAGAVSLLGGRPMRVRRVLRGFGAPRYTAVAPDGRHAFVSDSGHGEIAVIDLERERVVARAQVGAGARHVGLSPSGRTLLVALGSSAAAIAVVDVSDPRRPRRRPGLAAPFLAHDVGFSPSGRRIWVTAGRERRMAVLPSPGRRGDAVLLAADEAPQHVSFGPGVAYVASGDSGRLRVHALSDGRVVHTARVPVGSFNVQRAGGRVLTPSLGYGTLTVLDARGVVVARRRVARAAHDACLVR
jgi:DNA-binding beta-propeller fold protein YncE